MAALAIGGFVPGTLVLGTPVPTTLVPTGLAATELLPAGLGPLGGMLPGRAELEPGIEGACNHGCWPLRLAEGKLVAGIAGRCVSDRLWLARFCLGGSALLLTQPGGALLGALAAPLEAVGLSGGLDGKLGAGCPEGSGCAPREGGSDGRPGRLDSELAGSPSPAAKVTDDASSNSPSASTCSSLDAVAEAGRSGLSARSGTPWSGSDGGVPNTGLSFARTSGAAIAGSGSASWLER